jgi:hypothetical protein
MGFIHGNKMFSIFVLSTNSFPARAQRVEYFFLFFTREAGKLGEKSFENVFHEVEPSTGFGARQAGQPGKRVGKKIPNRKIGTRPKRGRRRGSEQNREDWNRNEGLGRSGRREERTREGERKKKAHGSNSNFFPASVSVTVTFNNR